MANFFEDEKERAIPEDVNKTIVDVWGINITPFTLNQ